MEIQRKVTILVCDNGEVHQMARNMLSQILPGFGMNPLVWVATDVTPDHFSELQDELDLVVVGTGECGKRWSVIDMVRRSGIPLIIWSENSGTLERAKELGVNSCPKADGIEQLAIRVATTLATAKRRIPIPA